jgi:hypothetical protein
MKLYVDTLVGNELKSTIWDLSSDTEQIILVTCDEELGKIWYIKIFNVFCLYRFRESS